MEQTLRELGLSDKETALYLLLLQSPQQTAQQLADQADIKRTNVYRLLDHLLEMGLIVADTSPVHKFSPTEPHALQALLQRQQTALKQTAGSLAAAMPHFRSQYSLSLDKPGVVHMAGREGFERLLVDMAHSRTEVLLVASNDVPSDDATLERFQELLQQRRDNGVPTRALFHDGEHRSRIQAKFSECGFDVRFTGTTPFKGEVVLYEDNTAFTVYDPSLIVTVLTNQHITDTMRLLFETVWSRARQ